MAQNFQSFNACPAAAKLQLNLIEFDGVRIVVIAVDDPADVDITKTRDARKDNKFY